MRTKIGRNLRKPFRSLVALGRNLFFLGRSRSGMTLFSVLAYLITVSSTVQAARPSIDLKDAVDKFVQSIPGSKQGGYKNPKDDLIARTRLVEGFKKARNGDLSAATKQLKLVNYTATLYVDSGTGREVLILQEQKDVNGAYPRAWGLYVIAWPPKQNLSKLVVEVPHACPRNVPNVPNVCEGGDTDSHLVGVEAFRSANARYLFINGAQRNATSSSDVAHQPESPFEKIHEAALDPKQKGLGANGKVYQSHRFFTGNHEEDPPVDNVKPGIGGVANVVVSNATKTPAGTLAEKVAVAVEAKDSNFFFVCLATGGGTCSDLAATTNVQKDNMFGGSFVHVEVNEKVYVCGSPCKRDHLAQAVADAMK